MGEISISINQAQFLPIINGTQNVSIYIDTLIISGLYTLKELQLLVPSTSSNISLESSIQFESLGAELLLSTGLEGSQYRQNMTVAVDLANVMLYVNTAIAVRQNALDNLYLDQITETSCLSSTIDFISITSIELLNAVTNTTFTGGVFNDTLVIENLSVTQPNSQVHTLEGDFVGVIDTFLQVVVHGFQDMSVGLLAGLLQVNLSRTLILIYCITFDCFRWTFYSYFCILYFFYNNNNHYYYYYYY